MKIPNDSDFSFTAKVHCLKNTVASGVSIFSFIRTAQFLTRQTCCPCLVPMHVNCQSVKFIFCTVSVVCRAPSVLKDWETDKTEFKLTFCVVIDERHTAQDQNKRPWQWFGSGSASQKPDSRPVSLYWIEGSGILNSIQYCRSLCLPGGSGLFLLVAFFNRLKINTNHLLASTVCSAFHTFSIIYDQQWRLTEMWFAA